MATYTYRRSAFESEKAFHLDDASLTIEEADGTNTKFNYEDISLVRLTYAPGRLRSNNYQCTIESNKGDHSFASSSFVSFANFRSDPLRYRAFVKELIAKLSAANPEVSLRSGKTRKGYIFSVVIMLALFFAIALLIYLMGDYMSSISWLKFILILLLIPMALSYVMKNRPGVFTADNIPPKLLPA